MVSILYRQLTLVCLWVFALRYLGFIPSVDAAPKSSFKKRLLAAEVAEEAASASASSSTAVPSARGSRQRLELLEATADAASPEPVDYPFTNALKRDWAAGELSAKKVQEYSLKTSRQGAIGMEQLSKMGTHGENPPNIHRDLLKLFGNPKGAPTIDWVNIVGKGGKEICQPFLMPHKFFASLFNERPDFFYRHLQGPAGAVREYWQNLASSNFVKSHPLLSNLDTTFPIGLHGDAGAFTKHDSLMVISWNGLLGRDCGRTKRIACTFVRKRDYTAQTLDAIWKIFSWSVNQMARGKHPVVDWDGNRIPNAIGSDLAGQFTAVLVQVRGDWQFYVEIFSFPPWNGAVRMCWMCRASSSNKFLAFTDTRESSQWRGTRFTDESYRAYMAALGLSLPMLLLLVIGLRLECISID